MRGLPSSLLLSLAGVFIAVRLCLLFFFSLPLTCLQSYGLLHRLDLGCRCCCLLRHRKIRLQLWRHVLLFPDLLPEDLFHHVGLLHPFLLLFPLSLRLQMPNLCCLMTWHCLRSKILSEFRKRSRIGSLEQRPNSSIQILNSKRSCE